MTPVGDDDDDQVGERQTQTTDSDSGRADAKISVTSGNVPCTAMKLKEQLLL